MLKCRKAKGEDFFPLPDPKHKMCLVSMLHNVTTMLMSLLLVLDGEVFGKDRKKKLSHKLCWKWMLVSYSQHHLKPAIPHQNPYKKKKLGISLLVKLNARVYFRVISIYKAYLREFMCQRTKGWFALLKCLWTISVNSYVNEESNVWMSELWIYCSPLSINHKALAQKEKRMTQIIQHYTNSHSIRNIHHLPKVSRSKEDHSPFYCGFFFYHYPHQKILQGIIVMFLKHSNAIILKAFENALHVFMKHYLWKHMQFMHL